MTRTPAEAEEVTEHGLAPDGRLFAGVRVAFVVNVDWFFLSHRLPLALALKAQGADVWVIAGDTGCAEAIQSHGLHFVPLKVSRNRSGLGAEAMTLLKLARIYRRLQPQLLHHVTLKPVLFGSLAARVLPGVAVVNALTGLGFTFSQDAQAAGLRSALSGVLRFALHHPRSCTIFQNREDLERFLSSRLVPEGKTALIRSSGVDVRRFTPRPPPTGAPVIMLASRLIWDKGIAEFVAAAEILRAERPELRFVLVGTPDAGNPNAMPQAQLETWAAQGIIEWWGQRDNMAEVLTQAQIFTLPTFYPEGVPKVLLEASACGIAIVASDTAGCREIIEDGLNGTLVPPREGAALAAALKGLLDDPETRARYARAGRERVLTDFSEEHVVAQTLEVYRTLLMPDAPSTAKD